MILVDANLLVYAYVRSMPEHERALAWLEERLNDTPPVGLPWASLLAFLRLVSNPRLFEKPPSIVMAWEQVETWLAADCTWTPRPTEQHGRVLGNYLPACTTSNNVPDAHLAALATEHGLILQTADHGFARFQGLRWENPLRA